MKNPVLDQFLIIFNLTITISELVHLTTLLDHHFPFSNCSSSKMLQRNDHCALSKILYKIQNENIKTLYCTRDTLVDKIDPFSNFIRINKRHCMYSSTSNKLVHQKFGWNRHFQAQVSTAFCLCHHILCMILITQRNVK